MKITSVKEIYFSPTGSTKAVTEILGCAWSLKKEQIDITSYKQEYQERVFKITDLCIFGVPSFGGRIPLPAVERIARMKGEGSLAVLVVTYGNRDYDDTLLELKAIVEQNGFLCIAAVAAVTEHSIMRNIAAGRPNKQDKKDLREYAGQIKRMVESGTENEIVKVPGSFPYREYHGVPMKPRADRNCSSCGKCAAKCPVGAIPKKNPKRTDGKICISCMRCVAVCPKKARKCSPLLLFIGGRKLQKACAVRKENRLFTGGGK